MSRLLFAALLFVAACGTTVAYSPWQSPPHAVAARAPSSVAMLDREPDRPYVTIGVVETQPDTALAEFRLTPRLRARMQAEAAQHGCDAILMHSSAPSAGTYGGVVGDAAGTSYRAGCIVFTGGTASR